MFERMSEMANVVNLYQQKLEDLKAKFGLKLMVQNDLLEPIHFQLGM